ncbi:fimbria/pilus outer membrane usher protein [Stenotrophomonas humi]|uniref:fimbria/pilus outer membrane usher protein n=1 Tax=Stenotrophomonas humi TaxID=405444 RepID=UPI001FDF6E60|nr:fimbria/pilus outer membrane usher protein [Stenotrophomonas humi]
MALAAQCFDAVAAEVAMSAVAMAPVQFDSEFLVAGGSRNADLSHFEKGNAVLPGSYRVDIYVNADHRARVDVPFRMISGHTEAQACFDAALLQRVGVNMERLPDDIRTQLLTQEQCLPLAQAVADARADFDFGVQRLNLSVPQAALLHRPRGYVDPSAWDAGINAAMLGYSLNMYRQDSSSAGSASMQGHLGLNMGVNVAGWRFRHDGSYRFDDRGNHRYQAIASYAKREVTSLAAELTVGETYTRGELFDSIAFRGLRLETDERMLPDSLRGYAPTVRGMAHSNARVTIRQNNVLIHESTVAPGEFEINDLYATGYGGDLQVTVQEADGSSRVFSVPFAAVPMSLRPGSSRFNAVLGQMRDAPATDESLFVQGTWQRGISNRTTGYTGLTLAAGYVSGIMGVALNTRLGAVGADITQSSTHFPGKGTEQGASYRLSYARDVASTGTNVSLAAYRYSTGGFYGLNEAVAARAFASREAELSPQRQRNRASLTLGQRLAERGGRLSVTASVADYWNHGGSDVNYSASYSGHFRTVGYSLSANRSYLGSGRADTQYYANFSLPLGRTRPQTLNSNFSHVSNGRNQAQTTLSGAAGEGSKLSYGLTATHTQGGGIPSDSGASANITYRAPKAELSASASAGSGYSQMSLAARGALVVHSGGWTLSQPISETFGIVEAADAEGARLLSASGVSVDRRGYAVIPYLTPYRMNAVELDPKGLSTDVELKASGQQVAPRAGAVALVKFATAYGRSAVLEVKRADGSVLPFGANVLDEDGREMGVVGQAGRVFARGLKEQGRLTVRWSDAETNVCSIDYALPQRQDKTEGIQTVSGTCRPG